VFASRFMPPYLPSFRSGTSCLSTILPPHCIGALPGPLDATAAAVIEGRLHMPKPRLTLRPSRQPNHTSWERNEAVKIALGLKFAVWVWQGIVEMVPWNCPLPLFIEPLGAVDKTTSPWWRILDARLSNVFQDAWGVWYFSVSQLAALLDVCDVMFAEDLEDAYHLSIFTGRPFWSRVFTINEHGQVVARWRLVMGCDVFSCLGLCDKAMSGFCIDGLVTATWVTSRRLTSASATPAPRSTSSCDASSMRWARDMRSAALALRDYRQRRGFIFY
jgi:hypothetical protein